MVASRPAVAAAAVTALAAGLLAPAAGRGAHDDRNSNKSVPVPHCHQSDTPKVGNS